MEIIFLIIGTITLIFLDKIFHWYLQKIWHKFAQKYQLTFQPAPFALFKKSVDKINGQYQGYQIEFSYNHGSFLSRLGIATTIITINTNTTATKKFWLGKLSSLKSKQNITLGYPPFDKRIAAQSKPKNFLPFMLKDNILKDRILNTISFATHGDLSFTGKQLVLRRELPFFSLTKLEQTCQLLIDLTLIINEVILHD